MHDAAPVSIIIVNWNRSDETLRALASLEHLRRYGHEIVVVDNGSTDGSAERLSRVESILFIALPTNVGPARARNVGIEHSSGRYLLFLDSDAVISGRSVARLVERMEGDPSIGIAGCRVINASSRKLDQWIYQFPARTHERREFDTYSFSAAGAIVRRRALEDAGLFWEDLFIYNEEVDLSIRVLRAGYRVIYHPRARVHHSPSDRGRQGPSAYWRLQSRNWIWICYRYYDTPLCYFNITKYIFLYILKGVFSGHLGDCMRGLWAGLAGAGIRRRFPEKLTWEEARRIDALRRRLSIRLGRG